MKPPEADKFDTGCALFLDECRRKIALVALLQTSARQKVSHTLEETDREACQFDIRSSSVTP